MHVARKCAAGVNDMHETKSESAAASRFQPSQSIGTERRCLPSGLSLFSGRLCMSPGRVQQFRGNDMHKNKERKHVA
ncbi:hypothetical protein BMW22_34070 (plasmid) [Rhizobium leguminosarum]|uniref:Uncharacterized protein n=2 Tax=Rhizobium TaxID=379 RepID=Q1M5E3_RHIJ3|nr:hypothetical protein BMW22_34070 [Rhizobium leguminosarum]CAK03546.1 hypothetical protein pRL110593 [Rhizobium johnstonii 3841]